MKLLLRILLTNQILALLITSALALVMGPRNLPYLWLPTLVFSNGVGTAVGLLFAGLERSEIYQGASPAFRNLARTAVVVAGTALGMGAGILVLARPGVRIPVGQVLSVSGFALLVAGAVSILHILFLRTKATIEQKAIEIQKLREMEAQTRLVSLQAKVNPHFLFNTLNTMLSLVRRSPDTVETLILELSELYRGVLQLPDEGTIPLGQELDLVRRYLEIERIRLGDRLTFTLDLAPEAASCRIPPLLVEPLVENAVKHGIGPRPRGGHVRIEARIDGERLRVVVADDGEGAGSGTGSGGFGLYSIRERLRMAYGGRAALEAGPLPGGGFRALLEVPLA